MKIHNGKFKYKYKIGDRVLYKTGNQKNEGEVIYIDTEDEQRPYLVSFFEDRVENRCWKLSYKDSLEEVDGIIPNSVITAHYKEYIMWVREEQLKLNDSKFEGVKGEEIMETKSIDIELEQQKELVKLGIKNLTDNLTYARVHNFKNVPRRNLTKTSLHNQIVQLRYQLKDLDEMINRYY